MTQTRIFHTVNEGIFLKNRNVSILFDGIHNGTEVGCSDMPIGLLKNLEHGSGLFADLDGIFFTHLHIDHFEKQKAEAYVNSRKVFAYGPGWEKSNIHIQRIDEDVIKMRIHHMQIFAVRTVHDGERFVNDVHVSYLVDTGEDAWVLGGDAILNVREAEIFRKLTKHEISGVFVNVYHILAEKQTTFIQTLQPEHVYLYHMPFPEDDVNHLRMIKKAALKTYPAENPEVEELQHMAWVPLQAEIENRKIM